MKRSVFLGLLLFLLSHAVPAYGVEKTIFGPVKYEVKERHGAENLYEDGFDAVEGLYVIKIRNGEKIQNRSDFLAFTLNGEKVVREGKYGYPFIACVVDLAKKNNFALMLKDAKPSGPRRPQLPARFVTVSVTAFAGKLPPGVYGFYSWDGLREIAGLLQKIKGPESTALAIASINLQNDEATRAEAMRTLSGHRNPGAYPFISALYEDSLAGSAVRGEAALALGMLGHNSSIPLLIRGMLDPNEKTRVESTRALSFFPEEDIREPFMELLLRLDFLRRDAVINAVINSGWKPIGTLLALLEANDPFISRTALKVIGTSGDPRAVEPLLTMLAQPGRRDAGDIITALAKIGDGRAIGPISQMAQDPVRRAGWEAELGDALVDLGDIGAEEAIVEMLRKTNSWQTSIRLQETYKRMTGKEYTERAGGW